MNRLKTTEQWRRFGGMAHPGGRLAFYVPTAPSHCLPVRLGLHPSIGEEGEARRRLTFLWEEGKILIQYSVTLRLTQLL